MAGCCLTPWPLRMKKFLLRQFTLSRLRRLGALAGFAAASLVASAQSTFQNVAIGGGGYVTGLVVHPQNPALVYARTDVGGTYRYNASTQAWIQLMGQYVGQQYYSCDSLAVDPSDTTQNKVYALIGNAGPAYLLYSSNQGGSWTDTELPTSIDGYGNGDYRWAGDRVAIDPNYAGRILVGTRLNGLWCNNVVNGTPNSGNWSQYTAVPVGTGTGSTRDGNAKIGVTFVAFYKQGGTSASGYTNIVYVGVSGQGVYETTNAGSSWSAMSGSPAYPVQGRVDSSGNLYVTGGNANAGSSYAGVWKRSSGTWTNITPSASSGAQFSGLSIDPNNASDIIVAVAAANSCPIYYSSNGGSTWSANKAVTQNNTVPWQPSSFFNAHVSYALFAPTTSNPNQVWFGDWYNVWNTPDITTSAPTWSNFEHGFEETYILACRPTSPTGTGVAPVFTGTEDDGGFRHLTLFSYPTVNFTGLNDTTSVDVYEGNNNYLYRVGDSEGTSGNGLSSNDNGVSWTAFGSLPSTTTPQGGRIAIAATNSSLIVWLPLAGTDSAPLATLPYYSANGGSTWTAASGIPSENWVDNDYYAAQELASNKATTNCFYVYHPAHGFYKSNTGSSAGSSYTVQSSNGLPSSSAVSGYTLFGVKSVPGQDGGVWVNLAGSGSAYGIYQSTNYGASFTQVSGIVSATAIAFGAAGPGSSQPATVYALGQKSGDTNDWVYESDDMGSTWTKLSSSANLFGDKAVILEADRSIYEQVYVGTFGTGLFSNVLFSDSFESGTASNWTVGSGTWSVVTAGSSKVYEVSSSTGGASQAGSSSWTDYAVSAEITPLTLIHGQTMELGLRYASASNNYEALLYPGALDIVRTVGGTQTVLATKSFTISPNTAYDVEFVAIGSTLNLYINGTLELTATDTSFSSGGVAVGAYNATGQFDNVTVTPQ